MKKSIRKIIALSAIALGAVASVSAAIAVSQNNKIESADAAENTYTIVGSMNGWNTSDETYKLTDSDSDGIYSVTINLSAGSEFKLAKNHSYAYARGCLASYPNSAFWGTGEWESDANIHTVTAGNYRVELNPDLGTVRIYGANQTIVTKTFYLLRPDSWTDWNEARIHWWGSNSGIESNYRAAAHLESTGGRYNANDVSGPLLKAEIPSDVTNIKIVKNDISAETSAFSLSGTGTAAGNLAYSGGNYVQGFTYVANGGYLRGCYHGVENWDTNIELSDRLVDEYVTYDYGSNEFHAVLELEADDYIKFVEYYEGVIYWRTIVSIESTNEHSYPADYSHGNNAGVTNAGVYHVTAGRDGDNEWYHFNPTAQMWAYEFLHSMTCNSAGTSEPTWATGKSWNYFAESYAALDDLAKDKFYNAASVAESSDDIENAVARYLVLVANHGYTPFLKHSDGTLRNSAIRINPIAIFGGESTNTSMIMMVILASVFAMVAVGGYFLLRKKRI